MIGAVIYLIHCTQEIISPEFIEEIIVNGYLIVGQGVDSIYVQKTLPIDADYSYDAASVSTDSIFISVDKQRFQLSEYTDKRGAYFLPKDSLIVTSGKTYNLEVFVDNKTIRASTMAPGQVHIQSLNADTSYYPYPDQSQGTRIQISWNPAEFTEAYELSVIAHPPYNLVNFGMSRIVEDRLDAFDGDTLKAFPPINDFPISKDETSIEISWYMFCYYGDYTIKLYAIDKNLWDMAVSSVLYMYQSSEFEQPIYNVEGGLGIFSAVSVDSVYVHVKRQ
ncbi:DUF4249 domain-containing protein [bacterium]|nr:DUF4249 domain-containing protein [bacterium]